MAYRYVGQQLYAPSLAGNSKWPIKILDYAQHRLERHYFCVKNSKQHRIEKVEEKSREIIMRKKIVEQRLFFLLSVCCPLNQKCRYSSAFASEVAGGASITNMVFTRTWIDEFYSEVKSQEKIDRNHWKSEARNSFRFYRWEWSLFLNSEASEREEICGEVVRLSLFAYVLRYIPAKSGGQLGQRWQGLWIL